MFAGAFEATFDRQGRFVLPAQLREYAGLKSEAVIVGSRNHAEIWAPDRWDAVLEQLGSPDALAQALAGLGI